MNKIILSIKTIYIHVELQIEVRPDRMGPLKSNIKISVVYENNDKVLFDKIFGKFLLSSK